MPCERARTWDGVFRFFPAQNDGPEAVSVAAETPELPRGRGEWVLFVDDEEPIRSTAKLTLESAGYHVLLAEDGAEAISLFAANQARIQTVITDLMMPVMDGYALMAALHRLARFQWAAR